MVRKLVIGANWKMNHSRAEARRYVSRLCNAIGSIDINIIEVYVLPPFTALDIVSLEMKNFPIDIGAQNVHWEVNGAFTGEISPRFLKEIGCTHVMIGHSERRLLFGETDEIMAKKVFAAFIHDIPPILCIGEDILQKEAGETEKILRIQLETSLSKIPAHFMKRLLILYEPRWAIGQIFPASNSYIETIHSCIRNVVQSLYDYQVAQETRVLYGGSVNDENILDILCLENVDGCGVGRASWDPIEFANLIHLTEKAASMKSKILNRK